MSALAWFFLHWVPALVLGALFVRSVERYLDSREERQNRR